MTLKIEDRIDMIHVHLGKAEIAYDDAIFLLDIRKSCDGAANRAYYAVFHAEKALLLTRGIFGEKHKHVHTQLSNQFVKKGEFPRDTGGQIDYVQGIRHIADYSGERSATEEEVKEALVKSKNFIDQAKEILQTYLTEQEAAGSV